MKYVLITGAGTGIGYETARYLIESGYFVFGNVLNQKQADQLALDFGDSRFKPLVFDVTDEQAIHLAVQEVLKITKNIPLAGIVNNAGVAIAGPLIHIKSEDLRRQFEVNVFGVLNVTKAFLPLLKGESPGRIINVSSLSGIIAQPFMALYASSKFALEAIADGLRRELFIYEVKVINILPGAVNTPIWDRALHWKTCYQDTDYALYFSKIDKRVEQTKNKCISPLRVAIIIHKALSCKRPRTRYIVDPNPLLIRSIRMFMPDKWLDAIMIRGLKKLAKADNGQT